MLVRTITLALASATLISACSQGDSQPASKARPSTATAPAAPVAAPAPKRSGEIDEALKERLARQEAAAKMFETKVLQPPAPKVADAPAAVKAATPAPSVAAAPAPAPVRVEPQKAAPQPATPSAPVQNAAAAPVQNVAAATPAPKAETARPAAPQPETAGPPRLVARVDPDFPREASQVGADTGMVKARMTLDAAGGVSRVEILEATPRRVFDRAVLRALSQWRYNAGPDGRTVDMEVAFKR